MTSSATYLEAGSTGAAAHCYRTAMTPRDSLWQPLLAGREAAEAVRTVEEIADALAAMGAPAAAETGGSAASLARGSAGEALFFHHAARSLDRKEYYARLAEESLDRAVEAISTEPMGYGLYGGITGIAWVLEHLRDRAGEIVDDPNEAIDDALHGLLARRPWRDSYDLIGGLVGLGVYAQERLPRPAATSALAAVIDHLSAMAESKRGHVAWFTPPEILGPWARSVSPAGHYDLGLAHGIPGILPLLGVACRAGVREEEAARLLGGGVSWLLAQQDRSGAVSCFADAIGPGLVPRPSRLAWCYGDAGVAVALLAAARLAGRPDWEQDALTVARHAARRPAAQSGVRDAGLCHGAFGLAHLFNRIYQATGDDVFAEAARFWYSEGFALRQPGQGIAGFAAWNVKEGQPVWSADTGFLTGAAGIGLALLAAVSSSEPEWDRVLLAAVPATAPAGSVGIRMEIK